MTDQVEAVLDHLERVAADAGRRAAEIESTRQLPRDLVDALANAGAFRLLAPSERGGHRLPLPRFVDAVEGVAQYDGSTAWTVMAGALAWLDAARLPDHHAQTVLDAPDAVVGGQRGGGGHGRITEDGALVVTGRWTWGSGVGAADWVGGRVRVVDDDGNPATTVDGATEVHAFLRRDQVVVLDTWHALGLRGAGATDYQATEAFVPEGRWLVEARDDGRPGTRRGAELLMAVGGAAVGLGVARRAIDELILAGSSRPDGTDPVLAERPEAAGELARLTVNRAAAADHLRLASERVDPPTLDDQTSTDLDRLLGAALHAVDVAVEIVGRCHRLGGAAAVLHASPLQRLLRDVNVVAQHPSVSAAGYTAIGQDLFDHRS